MKQTNNVDVRRRWEEFPQVGRGRLYAALRPSGFISISGYTHERMGSPDSYLLLYDRGSRTIGLKAARKGIDKNAYHAAHKAGSHHPGLWPPLLGQEGS